MWDYHTEATKKKPVKLVLGMIQSLLKLVTISAFIAQPFLTLSSIRNAVLEHLKSLVGACKEPQAKQVCAVFTRGTEAPCVILVQSTWKEAAGFPPFGGSAGHCPVLQPLGAAAGAGAAVQDHSIWDMLHFRVCGGPGNTSCLSCRQFLDSLTGEAVLRGLGNSSPVAGEAGGVLNTFPDCRLQHRMKGQCGRESSAFCLCSLTPKL